MTKKKSAAFAVDTGGTFTDVVARDAQGDFRVTKLLSSPADPSESIAQGIRTLLPSLHTSSYSLTHGTTVATNALLERAGAHTALITTRGFEDVLRLGRQARPSLYALHVTTPEPLVRDCYGLPGRMLSTGEIFEPLHDAHLDALIETLKASSHTAIAICLLHAYVNPEHESRVAARLRDAFPDRFICASSEIVRELREYERASTTAINAYVGPIMARYLTQLERRLHDAHRIEIFESSGARVPLTRASRLPVHTALSGPAGGVLGALAAAKQVGISQIITFDMGGTSTDVALCHGEPSLRELSSIGAMPLLVPTLDIHTVGAGGGSIASRDEGGALKVGPQSAGALPGPACYGRGGLLPTVTDAHVVLGRLLPAHFLGGEMTLDVDAATRAVKSLADELDMSISDTAQGMLHVADAAMDRAIKVISLEKGDDPRDFTLVSFGGAGGLHACRLAAKLGMTRVLIPQHPGLLSAYGMLHAERIARTSQTYLVTFSQLEQSQQARAALVEAYNQIIADARQQVGGDTQEELLCDVRYQGQSFALKVRAPGFDSPAHVIDALAAIRQDFEREHARLYGWIAEGREVELVTLRGVSAHAVHSSTSPDITSVTPRPFDGATELSRACFGDEFRDDTCIIERGQLANGHTFCGPAIIVEYSGTTLIPPGWSVRVTQGHLIAEHTP